MAESRYYTSIALLYGTLQEKGQPLDGEIALLHDTFKQKGVIV